MPKCGFCDKPAVVNYQKTWLRFVIIGEDYQSPTIEPDIEEPTGEDNVHLCVDHEMKWLEGGI